MQVGLIKKLRNITGSPIIQCKAALEECGNDLKDAQEYLRRKGLSLAHKKLSKSTHVGLVSGMISAKSANLIEVLCETDFVAKTSEFQDFIQFTANEWQNYSKDFTEFNEEEKISSKRIEHISKFQENILIRRGVRLEHNPFHIYGLYLHNLINKHTGQSGCLVSLGLESALAAPTWLEELANRLCMHVIASKPLFLNKLSIPTEWVVKERLSILEQLDSSIKSKPEKIKETIIKGKLEKSLESISFEDQIYAIDDSGDTVKALMQQASERAGTQVTLKEFYVFRCEDISN